MSSVYIIILITMLAFAIMLSGGSSSLFTGNVGSPAPPTPTPLLPAPTGSASTSPTPSSVSIWSVTATLKGCNIDGFPKADIYSEGPMSGYLKLSVESTGGSYEQVATAAFTAPRSTNTATLLNSRGFNTKPWRVELFSGGSLSDANWSGGTLRKVYVGSPTGCT